MSASHRRQHVCVPGLALDAERVGFSAVIVSADKDFGQLLVDGDEQWDFARGQRWGPLGVHARLGVHPRQVADYLALAGDVVDNIPGVPGIGAKTAAALLAHFDDLESLLARIDEIPFLRLRGAVGIAAKLRLHMDKARLARQLTAIALDAPVPRSAQELCRGRPDVARIEELMGRLRFGPGIRARVRALSPA